MLYYIILTNVPVILYRVLHKWRVHGTIHPLRNAKVAVFQILRPHLQYTVAQDLTTLPPLSNRIVLPSSHLQWSFHCQLYKWVKYTFSLLSDEIAVD